MAKKSRSLQQGPLLPYFCTLIGIGQLIYLAIMLNVFWQLIRLYTSLGISLHTLYGASLTLLIVLIAGVVTTAFGLKGIKGPITAQYRSTSTKVMLIGILVFLLCVPVMTTLLTAPLNSLR